MVQATAAELKQQLSELQARATDLEEDIKSRNQQCTKLAASLTDRVQARYLLTHNVALIIAACCSLFYASIVMYDYY
jgi:lipid II:glycine glycyltransferase (peptidoglycan interpeptide bridge formation enzyme)